MADSYVTNAGWTRATGRADAIDDIADQFERPAGAEEFWTRESRTEWPRSPRGWRSMGLKHRDAGARLAG